MHYDFLLIARWQTKCKDFLLIFMDHLHLRLWRLFNLIDTPSFFVQLENRFSGTIINIQLFGGFFNYESFFIDEIEQLSSQLWVNLIIRSSLLSFKSFRFYTIIIAINYVVLWQKNKFLNRHKLLSRKIRSRVIINHMPKRLW